MPGHFLDDDCTCANCSSLALRRGALARNRFDNLLDESDRVLETVEAFQRTIIEIRALPEEEE